MAGWVAGKCKRQEGRDGTALAVSRAPHALVGFWVRPSLCPRGLCSVKEGAVAIHLQSPLSYLGGDHNGDGMDDGDGDV